MTPGVRSSLYKVKHLFHMHLAFRAKRLLCLEDTGCVRNDHSLMLLEFLALQVAPEWSQAASEAFAGTTFSLFLTECEYFIPHCLKSQGMLGFSPGAIPFS